jgi:hypothetical protein
MFGYRRFGAVVIGIAAVGLLTAGCSDTPSPAPSSAASSTPAPAPSSVQPSAQPSAVSSALATGSAAVGSSSLCRTANLRVTLGPSEGAAGSTFRPIIFTNTGPRACTLRGFPGVSYVTGDDGRQVGSAAAWSGSVGATVKVAPGGRAVAQLQLVNVQNFDATVCKPTAVRGLRVYPPGERAAAFVPAPGTGCAGKPPGFQLSVRTVTAP